MRTLSAVNVVAVPVLTVIVAAMLIGGCSSTHEEGVSSNVRKQWATVGGNVKETTDAAKWALEQNGLKEVTSENTMVDGKATGKKADGTKVDVTITKKSEGTSEVVVLVGNMGGPTLGAEIVKSIQEKVEKK
jgi:hypothetical protein